MAGKGAPIITKKALIIAVVVFAFLSSIGASFGSYHWGYLLGAVETREGQQQEITELKKTHQQEITELKKTHQQEQELEEPDGAKDEAYDQGYKEGEKIGRELGYEEGWDAAHRPSPYWPQPFDYSFFSIYIEKRGFIWTEEKGYYEFWTSPDVEISIGGESLTSPAIVYLARGRYTISSSVPVTVWWRPLST